MLGACDPRIAHITWETESYPIEVKVAVVPPYKWQIIALNVKIKDKPIVSLGKGPPVFHQEARWRTRHQFNPIDRPLLTGRFRYLGAYQSYQNQDQVRHTKSALQDDSSLSFSCRYSQCFQLGNAE
jgi:hypothetical protein